MSCHTYKFSTAGHVLFEIHFKSKVQFPFKFHMYFYLVLVVLSGHFTHLMWIFKTPEFVKITQLSEMSDKKFGGGNKNIPNMALWLLRSDQ